MKEQVGSYTIVPFHESSSDYRDIFRFIKEHWARPVLLSDERFVRWQFENNPDDLGKNPSLLVLSAEGEVMGFLGLSHRPFYIGGQKRNGIELTTWILSDRLRGQGIGKAMMTKVTRENDVALGMGISDSALPIYLGLGFKYLRAIPRFFKILDIAGVASYSRIETLGKKLIEKNSDSATLQKGIEMAEVALSTELLRELDGHTKTFNGYSRDLEHLVWRYDQHPYFRYSFHRLTVADSSALLITRLDISQRAKVLHLIDVIGSPLACSQAPSAAEVLAREKGAQLVDFYCTSPKVTAPFWAEGWLSTLDDTYVQVPHLFHPIELRSPATTSLIMFSRTELSHLVDLSSLYITKGDCDFDRPTYQTLTDMETHGVQ
jgi:GNAT superfamily N-acetyltransferase